MAEPQSTPSDQPPASSTFPERDQFDSDPRVSFSLVSRKWILEQDDGAEFEYDEALRRWVPLLDESLASRQQAAYAVPGVDESEPAGPARKKQKIKKNYTSADPVEKPVETPKAGKKEPAARKNTAVYITNLPDDADEEEINSLFSRCGVIAEELDGGRPRIKVYRDDNGKVKGDALVIYFRPESVELAVQMLDDSDFRFGVANPRGKMKVQAADFSYKAQQDPSSVKRSAKEKRKGIAKVQKLKNKLTDWDDDDPSTIRDSDSRKDKLVILKHMFTLEELEEDPTAILDLKEDIREECSKLGDVTNVVLYDREPDGVVSVRFKTHESAVACVKVMDGRFFGGQKVEAAISDGGEKYKKSKAKDPAEADMTEEERLEKFGTWLEEEEKGK